MKEFPAPAPPFETWPGGGGAGVEEQLPERRWWRRTQRGEYHHKEQVWKVIEHSYILQLPKCCQSQSEIGGAKTTVAKAKVMEKNPTLLVQCVQG